jgi:hypothetical protein
MNKNRTASSIQKFLNTVIIFVFLIGLTNFNLPNVQANSSDPNNPTPSESMNLSNIPEIGKIEKTPAQNAINPVREFSFPHPRIWKLPREIRSGHHE